MEKSQSLVEKGLCLDGSSSFDGTILQLVQVWCIWKGTIRPSYRPLYAIVMLNWNRLRVCSSVKASCCLAAVSTIMSKLCSQMRSVHVKYSSLPDHCAEFGLFFSSPALWFLLKLINFFHFVLKALWKVKLCTMPERKSKAIYSQITE